MCHKSKKESEVTQSCLILCDPMDCSLPGSSVHGIFQARVLEWVAISFSRGSSWPDVPWLYATIPFYMRDLSLHRFWELWILKFPGVLKPIPHRFWGMTIQLKSLANVPNWVKKNAQKAKHKLLPSYDYEARREVISEPLQCYCLQPQLSLISEYLNCST